MPPSINRNSLWSLKHRLKLATGKIFSAVEQIRYSSCLPSPLSRCDVSSLIASSIESSEPILVSRLGSVESRILGEYTFSGSRFGRVSLAQAHINAGIFPSSQKGLSQAAIVLDQALLSVDLLAQWPSPYQARLISQPGLTPRYLCTLQDLEPWWAALSDPWTLSLQGKNVLIVHPFDETIRSQYHRRQMLFHDSRILPDFNLLTVRPPLTLCGLTAGFSTWSDALESLIASVQATEFDVALIACGAYGLPLASAVKSMGKPAIHLGGPLQLLFGIRGRRWEAMPDYEAMMNEHWVRPSAIEQPDLSQNVDGGCYW